MSCEGCAVLSKALSARVKVENELWLIATGAAPLPDREKCRDWAQRLGIPEDTLAIFKDLSVSCSRL